MLTNKLRLILCKEMKCQPLLVLIKNKQVNNDAEMKSYNISKLVVNKYHEGKVKRILERELNSV